MTGLILADLSHVAEHVFLAPGGVTLWSNLILMQLIGMGLLLYFFPRWAKRRAGSDEINRLVPTGWGNTLEFLCWAIREHVARPNLGAYTDRFIGFVWSVFFFILISNLLGLLPLQDWTGWIPGLAGYYGDGHSKWYVLGGTPTGNIWITVTLAAIVLVMIFYNGLKLHGMNYVRHFFMGPAYLAWFIAVLEVVGVVAKSGALAVRLWANMVAGHMLLATIVGFAGGAIAALGGTGLLVAIPVVLGSVAIMFLELFVAFLQAFIFTFLTCVFIGLAVNIHHDEHHEHHEEMTAAAYGEGYELGT